MTNFVKIQEVTEEKFRMFENRVVKVYRHLSKQARKASISCYRIYDHDLPEFPFCIELYEEHLYVAEYKRGHGLSEEAHEHWIARCIEILSEIIGTSGDKIFLKLRQRKPGRLGQYQKLGAEQNEFEVVENKLKFLVNLGDYLDTGLFLDHRITREMVRKNSSGKRVLNLFAYTGSFSVYAAAGGAQSVKTVDLSKTYLAWAERNMKLNLFEAGAFTTLHADVKKLLTQLPDESEDLIIMDPPTFSNSKRMEDILDIQRDHVELINNCLRILSVGGSIYFSSNLRNFELNKAGIKTSKVKDITRATTPFDFDGKLSRCCFLIQK